MNSVTGTSRAHEIVPRSAQASAVVVILLAMATACGAASLVVGFAVSMAMSIAIDPPQHFGLAFWSLVTLASLLLHIRGEHRRPLGIALGLLVPVGFIWLVATEQEAGGVLFFLAIILHALLGGSTVLSLHAARLDSPKFWFNKRIAERVCPRCGYDIRKLPSPRCPECGFDFSESPRE